MIWDLAPFKLGYWELLIVIIVLYSYDSREVRVGSRVRVSTWNQTKKKSRWSF